MDRKELKLLGKKRDDLIQSLYSSYDVTLSEAQSDLFKRFPEEILDKLEYDNEGKVINNAKNRNVIISIDKFFVQWNEDTNPKIITALLDSVQQIMTFNYSYYSKFNEVPKAKLIKLREKALNNVKGWLGMDDTSSVKANGYLDTLVKNDTIKNQLKDAVLKTVYAQEGFGAAKKIVGKMIVGDKTGALGSLKKYHRNFTYDLYSQIDRATGKTYADDLGFQCAIYEGGLIETSRPFCKKHNGNVYHISEILKMKPEVAISDDYNPLFDMGGYGCRHHWNWIPWALALILRPELAKFKDPKPEDKADEKPAKIIDVEAVRRNEKK